MTPVTVPPAAKYKEVLSSLEMTDKQRLMLRAHYEARNRSVSFGKLAKVAGYADHKSANLQYGLLGASLGGALGFRFEEFEDGETDFRSSAIGMPTPKKYREGEFELTMHHELAKALQELRWFDN